MRGGVRGTVPSVHVDGRVEKEESVDLLWTVHVGVDSLSTPGSSRDVPLRQCCVGAGRRGNWWPPRVAGAACVLIHCVGVGGRARMLRAC